jgi:hypothetical protein
MKSTTGITRSHIQQVNTISSRALPKQWEKLKPRQPEILSYGPRIAQMQLAIFGIDLTGKAYGSKLDTDYVAESMGTRKPLSREASNFARLDRTQLHSRHGYLRRVLFCKFWRTVTPQALNFLGILGQWTSRPGTNQRRYL